MKVKRRDFINLSALATDGAVAGFSSFTSNEKANEKMSVNNELQSLAGDVVPITVEERKARIEKAQRLLAELLEPGMCFSIEPNISIPGEFGVRLEDCVYRTTEDPRWFSQPVRSISEPFQ